LSRHGKADGHCQQYPAEVRARGIIMLAKPTLLQATLSRLWQNAPNMMSAISTVPSGRFQGARLLAPSCNVI